MNKEEEREEIKKIIKYILVGYGLAKEHYEKYGKLFGKEEEFPKK